MLKQPLYLFENQEPLKELPYIKFMNCALNTVYEICDHILKDQKISNLKTFSIDKTIYPPYTSDVIKSMIESDNTVIDNKKRNLTAIYDNKVSKLKLEFNHIINSIDISQLNVNQMDAYIHAKQKSESKDLNVLECAKNVLGKIRRETITFNFFKPFSDKLFNYCSHI